MPMFRVLLLILAIAVLYKLIFGLIIPVYRTTREMKKRFRDINQQMEANLNQFNAGQAQSGQATKRPVESKKSTSGKDYIEFEEVK